MGYTTIFAKFWFFERKNLTFFYLGIFFWIFLTTYFARKIYSLYTLYNSRSMRIRHQIFCFSTNMCTLKVFETSIVKVIFGIYNIMSYYRVIITKMFVRWRLILTYWFSFYWKIVLLCLCLAPANTHFWRVFTSSRFSVDWVFRLFWWNRCIIRLFFHNVFSS